MKLNFVEIAQLILSGNAILFDVCVFIVTILVIAALLFAGYFLVSYLQRSWDKPNFALEAHAQFDLRLGNLDKSDKDDAKKSSKSKGDDS